MGTVVYGIEDMQSAVDPVDPVAIHLEPHPARMQMIVAYLTAKDIEANV
jgi:hypothetical protein